MVYICNVYTIFARSDNYIYIWLHNDKYNGIPYVIYGIYLMIHIGYHYTYAYNYMVGRYDTYTPNMVWYIFDSFTIEWSYNLNISPLYGYLYVLKYTQPIIQSDYTHIRYHSIYNIQWYCIFCANITKYTIIIIKVIYTYAMILYVYL